MAVHFLASVKNKIEPIFWFRFDNWWWTILWFFLNFLNLSGGCVFVIDFCTVVMGFEISVTANELSHFFRNFFLIDVSISGDLFSELWGWWRITGVARQILLLLFRLLLRTWFWWWWANISHPFFCVWKTRVKKCWLWNSMPLITPKKTKKKNHPKSQKSLCKMLSPRINFCCFLFRTMRSS